MKFNKSQVEIENGVREAFDSGYSDAWKVLSNLLQGVQGDDEEKLYFLYKLIRKSQDPGSIFWDLAASARAVYDCEILKWSDIHDYVEFIKDPLPYIIMKGRLLKSVTGQTLLDL